MAVGVLLVTHRGVGPALHDVAARLLGNLTLALETYELDYDSSLDIALPLASALLRRVDSGDGVLLLSDLYGASPSRLAQQLAHLGTPTRRVAGLSLPMLLRVLNHAEADLDELARIAATGCRNGAITDDA